MRNHSNHHTKWKKPAIVRTNARLLISRMKKQYTEQTKQNHKNYYETNFRCRLNVYQQQQYCTQFAHEHVRNITEDQSLVSTFGIQIENKKTASDGWILWIRIVPHFTNAAKSQCSMKMVLSCTQRHTCTGMDPTDCHVIVRLSPSSSSIPCLLIDMIILSRAYFAVHRVLNWTPQKTCPWNGSHRKKNKTVPRLARCRKLCHQLNSISMQRNIYR